LSIRCIAYCQRCNRPYAAGDEEAVGKVVKAMRIPAFIREKPRQRHVCPRCKDELIDRFVARCGQNRREIEQCLRVRRHVTGVMPMSNGSLS
jgi:hypothetical protein